MEGDVELWFQYCIVGSARMHWIEESLSTFLLFSHLKGSWIVLVFGFSPWRRKATPGCAKAQWNLGLSLYRWLGCSWLPHITGLSKECRDLQFWGHFSFNTEVGLAGWYSLFLSSIFNMCSCCLHWGFVYIIPVQYAVFQSFALKTGGDLSQSIDILVWMKEQKRHDWIFPK